jgi:NADH-ubiquinone oxidoreductase chain 5
MEGPTPVSALLHAATMVTAGVFLVLRCSLFFEYSPEVLILLSFIGGITAFIAGIIAIFQYDIKKIIAYSTCSQLGYMFFSCGLSNYYVAFFHLFNHAFFKALLFLCAGCLIHIFHDEQDLRKMGGLFSMVPFIYISFVIGSLSIMGFFFLTGFYSKDLILEFTYSRYVIQGFFIYFLGLVSALFTAGYSVKLIHFAIRIKKTNSFRIFYSYDLHDANNLFKIILLILNLCSIFIGFIFNDLMLGFGSNF